MARLRIAARLRLWLALEHSGPVEDALCASAGSQAKSNLRSPGVTKVQRSSLIHFIIFLQHHN